MPMLESRSVIEGPWGWCNGWWDGGLSGAGPRHVVGRSIAIRAPTGYLF